MKGTLLSWSKLASLVLLGMLMACNQILLPSTPKDADTLVAQAFAQLQQKLTGSGLPPSGGFGTSVAVSGDTAVIGATYSAYVFTRTNGTWTQRAILTGDGRSGYEFGSSVSISGNTIAVGDFGDSFQGAVHIYTGSGSTWSRQAKLTASDSAQGDNFGRSVVIDGDTVIVGADGDGDFGPSSGSAYIFTRTGTSWTQQAKLTANDGAANDNFGVSVSVAGDSAVVGAPSYYAPDANQQQNPPLDSGSVYVFKRSSNIWTQQAKLTASNSALGNSFGTSVAISTSGETVIAGASFDDTKPGKAYVFTRSGTTWTQQAGFAASDATSGDYFGGSVSLSTDNAIVGAGKGPGSAYVFTRSGSAWTEQAKLTASDALNFGSSVTMSGDTVVVGAPRSYVNSVFGVGAGYVYKLTLQQPPLPVPTTTTLYLSSSTSGNAGGIAFDDEDILSYNTVTQTYSLLFDGSDVGLTDADLSALYRQPDGSLLLSLESDGTIPGFGTVDGSDIVKFVPSSLGDNTQGTFSWFFDGSDVGLTLAGEHVDAIGFTAAGDLLVSTNDVFGVTGASGRDEDVIAFKPTSLGATTSGTWSIYFDGSDVGLYSLEENVRGVWMDATNGDLYLGAGGTFTVPGLSGGGEDVLRFAPTSLGATTTGSFSSFWQGELNGFAYPIDGLSVLLVRGPSALTFKPSQDSYVKSDYPNTNYGNATVLRVDGSPAEHTLLTFNISGVGNRRVTSAKLRLYNTNSSASGGDLYRVSDTSWSESSVTWSTAPAAQASLIASLAAVAPGNWYELNVTSVVIGDGSIGFKLTSHSPDGAFYSSSEGSFSPELIVTTE